MSALIQPAPQFEWPADVLEFAARNKVDGVLEPLRQATWGLFPKIHRFTIFLEDDPEIRDDWHIVYEVVVSTADVPHPVPANNFWIDELYRCCPAPLVCIFRLCLLREP